MNKGVETVEHPPRVTPAVGRPTRSRLDGLRTVAAAGLLLAVGTSAYVPRIRDGRALASHTAVAGEPIGTYDRSFRAIAPFVPRQGVIGYLDPADWSGPDTVRAFYLAEYALAPRIVVFGTAPEFLIVVPETGVRAETADLDPRLTGFALVRQFEDGLLLFRRTK